MIEELSDEEELVAGVSLSLRKNPLINDGSMIPQVSAREASIKMVLAEIEKENSDVKTSLVRHHLKLYQDKLLDLLKRGYDVKVLDLGVLHIKAKGLVSSSEEAAEISDWTVRFTPTKKTLEAVKGLSVEAASVPDCAPIIENVTDLYRCEADGRDELDGPSGSLWKGLGSLEICRRSFAFTRPRALRGAPNAGLG